LAPIPNLNLHRRHLTTDQLVELGARIAEPLREAAIARIGQNQWSASEEGDLGPTSVRVAEALGGVVSRSTLERGWAVKERSPELWRDVQRGARSVTGAYRDMQGPKQVPFRTAENILALIDNAFDRIVDLIGDLEKVGATEENWRFVASIGRSITETAEKRA
jgi:hypothetical protein